MKESITHILDEFLKDPHGFKAKVWATQQGLCIDYYASQLSAQSIYATSDIAILLMSNNKELYKKCVDIKRRGEKIIGEMYSDVLLGGSKKITSTSIDEDGSQNTSIKTIQLSKLAIKKLLISEKDPEAVYHTMLDSATVERFYSIKETKQVIPERALLKSIEKLQTYQFQYYEIVKDYLETTDREIECKNKSLYLHLRGGYQSGKTVACNVILAYLFNTIVNSELSGDIMIFGATTASLRRNIVNRICAEYPTLSKPSSNSTTWNLGNGLVVHLMTTGLSSFHGIKGSSIAIAVIDELDAMHPEVLDLIQTRMTGFIKPSSSNSKDGKCIMISTSNPKNPNHHVSEFLDPKNSGSITKCVETWRNKYITQEYFNRMVERCGGKESNKYKREICGECVYLTNSASIFKIREEETFTDETIDNYLVDECPRCNTEFVGSNKECETCNHALTHRKFKNFIKVNIGYDHGSSVPKVFICTFFYVENGIIKALVLDELFYEGGHDLEFSKRGRYDELVSLKEQNLKNLIEKCYSICKNVQIIVPHDAISIIPEFSNTILKYGLHASVTRPPAPAKQKLVESIALMNNLFEEERIKISHSCKMLKSELFNYQYDLKKQEDGFEAVKKGHDHAIDALRYSIISEISLDDIYKSNISET